MLMSVCFDNLGQFLCPTWWQKSPSVLGRFFCFFLLFWLPRAVDLKVSCSQIPCRASSPGFEPNLWLRVRHPNHSATTLLEELSAWPLKERDGYVVISWYGDMTHLLLSDSMSYCICMGVFTILMKSVMSSHNHVGRRGRLIWLWWNWMDYWRDDVVPNLMRKHLCDTWMILEVMFVFSS
jgi:hypothetical protein